MEEYITVNEQSRFVRFVMKKIGNAGGRDYSETN